MIKELGPDGGAAPRNQGWGPRSMVRTRGGGGRALLGEDAGGVGDQGVGGAGVNRLDYEPGMGRFLSKSCDVSFLT